MFNSYSGATRIVPILGNPIAQTKSPYGLTRGFAERNQDVIVVPLDVKPDTVAEVLRALGTVGNLAGILATVPHKFAAYEFAATATSRANFFGSANILRRTPDGRWQADMLDGVGFIRAINAAGGKIEGRHALLVGAGGAGSAIALELLNAGARTLAVHDTNDDRRAKLLSKLDAIHPGKSTDGTADPTGFDLVINGTPLGMRADDPHPVDFGKLTQRMFVGDVVTAADTTPLLRAATSLGCVSCSGHDMFHASLDLMLDYFIDAQS